MLFPVLLRITFRNDPKISKRDILFSLYFQNQVYGYPFFLVYVKIFL